MALPADFWRNEQLLNIFKTKPCQRLANAGVCQWKSQCQFSHCSDWPRRQPRRHRYSTTVCPSLVAGAASSPDGLANPRTHCAAGLTCPYAHSKEEVLFHPDLFKTQLCEEHGNSRSTKRSRCHRYYCPFAHGNQELRTSSMTPEDREECLRALKIFPSSTCCMVCTQHFVPPDFPKPEEAGKGQLDGGSFKMPPAQQQQQQQQQQQAPQSQQQLQQQRNQSAPNAVSSATSMGVFGAWSSPPTMTSSTMPLQPRPTRPPMPCQPTLLQKESQDVLSTCPAKENPSSLICSPCNTMPYTAEPYDPWASMRKSPVFINIGEDGSTSIGPRQADKLNSLELKDLMYAML